MSPCGHAVAAGQSFCTTCGAVVPPVGAACPNGHPMAAGLRFCTVCGLPAPGETAGPGSAPTAAAPVVDPRVEHPPPAPQAPPLAAPPASPAPVGAPAARASPASAPAPVAVGRRRRWPLLVLGLGVLTIVGAVGAVGGARLLSPRDDEKLDLSAVQAPDPAQTTSTSTSVSPATTAAPPSVGPTTSASGATPQGPSTSPAAPATTSQPSGSVVPIRPLSAVASSERPSIVLRCTGETIGYAAANLIDSNPNTGWGSGVRSGQGQTVKITFAAPVPLRRVGLTPGYIKVGPRPDQECRPVSAFGFNRQLASVRYTFDDGTSIEQAFKPEPVIQYAEVATTTRTVTITILGTVRPPGADDDTILSEVAFEGVG